MRLALEFLGGARVTLDGVETKVGGRRPCSLLGALALAEGHVVSADRLVDLVWDEDPPPTARRTLQSYVADLRRVLGGDDGPLSASGPGYVLEIERAQVDLFVFADEVARAKRELSADPAEAAAVLAGALERWAPPLDGLRPSAALQALLVPYEELRLEAVEVMNDVELDHGEAGRAVARLEMLVREHPVRERFWAQLIRGHVTLGRRDAALHCAQRAREALREHLGIGPSPILQRLEREVLDADAADVAPARTEQPIVATRRLPRRLADVTGNTCVGRDGELHVLREAWNAVMSGRRQIALVAGEPGIGKTRLVAELARTAQDAVVAYGWCDPDSNAALLPWVHIVGSLVRGHPSLLADALSPSTTAEISRLVPELAGDPSQSPGGDAETIRLLLFDAIDAFLTAISSRQPLLVVVDDLHWADAGSLALIRHLLRSDRAAPLLVVGTYRDTDIERTHPVAIALGALRREPNAVRVSLTGLARDSLESLIAGRVGHPTSREFVDLIYDETAGNPFFTEEVLTHLVESGAVVEDDSGSWVTTARLSELGVPDGVRDVLGRRLSRLPAETNDALAVAAVIGPEFDLDVLAELLAIPRLDVAERLEPAAEAGLVQLRAGNAVGVFAHALVRESLLGELRSVRRARLHWACGRAWAERVGAAPAVIAHHLCEGALAGDVGDAVSATLDAATAASRIGASEDQLSWAERALEVLAGHASTYPELHIRALLHRGAARKQSGGTKSANVDLLAAASLALDRSDHLLALNALVPAVKVPIPDLATIALTERAVAEIPSDTVAGGIAMILYAHLNATRGLPFDLGDADTVLATLGEDIPLELVTQVHDSFLDLVGALPDLERVERACTASVAVGDRRSSPMLRACAAMTLAQVAARRGNRAALEFERDRVRGITRAGLFRIVESVDVALAVADGRLDEAEVLAGESESPTPNPIMSLAIALQLDWIADRRAARGEPEPALHYAGRLPLAFGLARSVPRARAGDVDAARHVHEALVSVDLTKPILPRPIVDTLFALAEAVVFVRDADGASLLIPRLEPYAGQLATSFPLLAFWLPISSSLGRMHALVGATDLAVIECESGLELARRMRAPLLAAESSLPLADVLLQREAPGDRGRAHFLLDEAITVAEGCGARLVADMARELRQS